MITGELNMKMQVEMVYVGTTTGTSRKSGNSYYLPKFMDMETQAIYEFYVPADKVALAQGIIGLKQFTATGVTLELTSFNNKPQVDLVAVEQ